MEQLPTVMQNIGLALLTIFIPLALFLFEKNEDKSFAILDKAVILDYLVGAGSLLWKIGLIFLPLLFWDFACDCFKVLIFILWAIGVGLVVGTLAKSYNWFRKGRFQYRIAYLKKVNSGNELEDLWRSVWDASGTNVKNEEDFFRVFSNLIDNLLKDKDNIEKLKLVAKLLNDFQTFIQKRSFIFLTAKDDVFQKVLEWHFVIWEREYENLLQESKLNQSGEYTSISNILDTIISLITERAFAESHSYGFFRLIHEHGNKHQADFVHGDKFDYYYIESFLRIFYEIYFNEIKDAKDRHDIWGHYFPREWMVTKEHHEDPSNFAARITCNEFLRWAQDRIQLQDEEKIDESLEEVSRELFPSTEPIYWSIILTLLIRPFGKGRMKSLIESPRSFGHVGRIYSSWGRGEGDNPWQRLQDNRQAELQTTIELAYYLFPREFTIEKLQEYISELKSLAYPDDESRELYRKQVLEILKRFLDYVRQ